MRAPCLRHTEEGHLEAVCRTETSVYCMDALGAHVASGGVAGEVQLWDLHTGERTGGTATAAALWLDC